MAAATQKARSSVQQQAAFKGNRETENKGNALQNISQPAGIAIMVVLLIASLFVGNFRALQRATPKAFLRQGDVKSIIEDRLDAAGNAKMVAMRAQLDALLTEPVEDAMKELKAAKTAREISRADQDLTAAVSNMIAEAKGKLDSENRTMLQSAADDFTEMGSFLRQEARSFNEQAEKAEALYEKLPTKFLFAEPDVYEGI